MDEKTTGKTSVWENLQSGLDERLKITELSELASHKTVPAHKHAFWYYFGGLSLLFFIVQFVTGVLLLFHYEGSLETAYASIMRINTQVEFGQLVRSLHSWSANLMVMAVLVHMFSTYFMKAYQRPRELTWLSGVILLFLTVVLGFTGYLLPWDKTAYFATKVGLDIAGSTPWVPSPWNQTWVWVGTVAADILRGGSEIGNLTMQRFFALHAVVLPWVFAGVLFFHLFLIQLHGISIPKGIREKKEYSEIKFFPTFLYDEIFAWTIAFVILCLIALLSPWGLDEEADLLASAPIGIKPEWYFMAPFELLKWMPPSLGFINGEFLGVALFGGAAIMLFFLPLWDTDKAGKPISVFGKFVTYYGIFSLCALVFFTLVGYYCLDTYNICLGNLCNKQVCAVSHDFLPWVTRGFKPREQ